MKKPRRARLLRHIYQDANPSQLALVAAACATVGRSVAGEPESVQRMNLFRVIPRGQGITT